MRGEVSLLELVCFVLGVRRGRRKAAKRAARRDQRGRFNGSRRVSARH